MTANSRWDLRVIRRLKVKGAYNFHPGPYRRMQTEDRAEGIV